MADKVVIRRLPTGVPGLDNLLGGGLPEFSFNLIAGSPGSGKTTLAHQIMFSLASPEQRAIFFTVLGEPPLKMLRYQQQFNFFHTDKVNESIRFINLADDVEDGNYRRVLDRILAEVEAFGPALVVVDSFRSVVVEGQTSSEDALDLQRFSQRLGTLLTTWQATTFLIGEYITPANEAHAIFTVADGILWMSQDIERNSMMRKIQVMKMRGQASAPGLHTFRIDADGVQVFPRAMAPTSAVGDPNVTAETGPLPRLSMGVPELDAMLGGGLPQGYSMLVSGPSGSGKSLLAAAFLEEGARAGGKGILAAFESSPSRSYKGRLDQLIRDGDIGVIDTRSLDLSIDETLFSLTELIKKTSATRLVIDSLSGFELALAPGFRTDFRETLYRMITVLTGLGCAVVMLSELEDRYADLRFSPYGTAFLTDAIVVQRYVEMRGELRRVMAVVKLRNSNHSHELRPYQIRDGAIVIGEAIPNMDALLTGHPRPS